MAAGFPGEMRQDNMSISRSKQIAYINAQYEELDSLCLYLLFNFTFSVAHVGFHL
jgi:hypothetical protein